MSTTPESAGQDLARGTDTMDNLQDADTLADLGDPTLDSNLDGQTDGDRQLTTDSGAIDEGHNNDSDLGADAAGLDPVRERYAAGGQEAVAGMEGAAELGPDVAPPAGGGAVTGGGTGLGAGLRE